LPQALISEIDDFSVKEETTRSVAVRRLIEAGLKSFSDEKPGR
jgi:metal-responsive CopG/Arc/MetJ family transcriptional regulator